MDLTAQLEALLFLKAEPVPLSDLARMVGEDEAAVKSALMTLTERLAGRGVTLIENGASVALATAPEQADLIERVTQTEREHELGKAGLETLAIVLYRGPISRSDIDYIRGVNATYILRQLLMRGLIERMTNPSDSRSFLYRPTLDLLSFLGVRRVEDLPNYAHVRSTVTAFEKTETESADEES